MNLSSRPFDDTSLDGILQSIAWGLRSAYHTSLQTTPGHLTFGRDMVIHATYLANWHAIRQRNQSSVLRNNARENRRRQRHTYRVGDLVFVSNQDIKRKLAVKEGPFPITKVHTNGTITIQRSTAVSERINIRRVHPVFWATIGEASDTWRNVRLMPSSELCRHPTSDLCRHLTCAVIQLPTYAVFWLLCLSHSRIDCLVLFDVYVFYVDVCLHSLILFVRYWHTCLTYVLYFSKYLYPRESSCFE